MVGYRIKDTSLEGLHIQWGTPEMITNNSTLKQYDNLFLSVQRKRVKDSIVSTHIILYHTYAVIYFINTLSSKHTIISRKNLTNKHVSSYVEAFVKMHLKTTYPRFYKQNARPHIAINSELQPPQNKRLILHQ